MPSNTDNWRVVVYPSWYRWSSVNQRELCNIVKAAVERHIDDVASVEVEWDTVCADCGRPWEEPPGCCGVAVDSWLAEHPEWSLKANGDWERPVRDA